METKTQSKRIMGIVGIVIAIALALALGSLSFSFLSSAHATGDNAAATQEESQVNDLAAPEDSAAATDDAAAADEAATQEAAEEPEAEQAAPVEGEPSDGDASEPSADAPAAPAEVASPLTIFDGESAGDLIGENLVSSISDIIPNSSGEEMYKTTIAVLQKQPESDNSYAYKTGQESQLFIAISNQDNIAMTNTVRVYFAYDGASQDMGSFLGGHDYNLLNSSTGTTYKMKVVETDVPNVFYYEITGILPSETLGFSNSVLYPSPSTPGGTLRIWTTSVTSDVAAETEGKVIEPTGDYMQISWDTDPVKYAVGKTNTTVRENTTNSAKSLSPTVQASPTEQGVGVVENLAWNITERNTEGSPNKSEGLDYVLKGTYEDVIDLPEELSWRPEVLDVIENGQMLTGADINNASVDGWWRANTSITWDEIGQSNANVIRVRKDGVQYDLAYIFKKTSSNSTGITDFTPHIVTVDGEKKLQLTWYLKNSYLMPDSTNPTYANAEYGAQSFYLRAGDNVILADLDKINEAYEEDPSSLSSLIKLSNTVDETRDYSYSPDETTSSTVERVVNVQTGWDVRKEWKENPYSSRYPYGGTNDYTVVKINNTGILNISQWGKQLTDEGGEPTSETDGVMMTDSLDTCYYITPENIVGMLNESVTAGRGNNSQTVPVGDWLTITITKASLFTPDAYQPSDGIDQNGKYASSGTINANADANCRKYEGATIAITKNAEGKIEVTLSDDPIEENNKTYTVDDAAGLNDLFTQIGYFPTRTTVYTAKYELEDDESFTLYPGQEIDLTLRSTTKTTPMMLTRDAEDSCPENNVRMNNTANVNAQVAGQYVTEKPSAYHNYYHYWNREMYVSKYGYTQSGGYVGNGGSVSDGTVMNNCIHGNSYGSATYDRMQFADHLTGAQVLMVPVSKNLSLTAPDGTELERFDSGGKSYWLLNKPGTYENVVVGGTGQYADDSLVAPSITVTRTGSGTSGSLDTVLKWNPFEKWNKDTYIWYRSLVSASKAGLISSDEAAEGQEYRLSNRAWLGDHQGHRLYDVYGLRYDVFRHEKTIVDPITGKGDGTDSKANGTLVTESRITNGETVTYELDIRNVTQVPVLITADMMRDRLPYGYEVIDWDTTNVGNIRYYAPEGTTIKAGSTSIGINGESTEGIPHYNIRKSTEGSGSNAKTVHDLRWNSDFQVSLAPEGTLKILVDVTFPERPEEGESLWDQYVNTSMGAYIYNTFYFNNVSSQVRHTLEAEGRPVLYKGVVDTGLTTHGGYTDKYRGSYYTNKSRIRYVNGGGTVSWDDADLKAETITYYTVLYNGSYDRLYLEDMQDQLPRGFTFNSFCNIGVPDPYNYIRYYSSSSSRRGNTTDKGSTTYSQNYLGYTGNNTYLSSSSSYTVFQTLTEGYDNWNSSNKLVTISNKDSAVDNNTIKYVNAKVTAQPSFNAEDGRQHLTFKVSNASQGNGQAAVHYDAKVGKYYLNPGEAIRFGYNCLVGKHSDTDDLATNTVAMPYYDYYGIGFDLHTPSDEDGGAVQKARNNGSSANDGGCELYTDEAVAEKYHMNTSAYQDEAYKSKEEGNWLVSDVTVERAPIVPGMIKNVGGITPADQNPTDSTVQGSLGDSVNMTGGKSTQFGTAYSGAAHSTDIVNWRLRVYNESGGTDDEIAGMLSDYQVVDTVAEPYAFTGRVFYNMYNNAGVRGTTSSQFLFTIGNRTEGQTSVRVAAGTSPTNNNGRNITIGSAEDDSDDDWFQFGTGSREGYVKIEKNADGQEVMTIQMAGSSYAVPGGNYMQLAVHTQYTKDQVVISDLKYNDVVLYPEQDYESDHVVNGRARTKQAFDPRTGQVIEENDGVQSGASVVLNQGFTTSATKDVTQLGKPSNTASSESATNYISLDEKHDGFRYDLYVNGPESDMSKIVIIDDLPQEGDHSAFVEADKRNSDFTVGFLAENPQFYVAIAPKGGQEKQLTENYRLYVNAKTDFTKDDWRGNGDGWVDITDLTGDELTSALEDARSVRVVIEDPEGYVQKAPTAYLMSKECKIHFAFNAQVDDPEAKPGEFAWNSFGYRYTVPLTHMGTKENSSDVDLEAQPLSAGVRYPAAPSLEKRLVVLEQKLEPKTEEVEVTKEVPVLDENGQPTYDGDGNPIMTKITEVETRVVTEDVPRPVYDPATGEPVLDEDGNPVTEMVPEPVMVPVYDENGNAVMELKEHPANEDLDFGFIVYKGEPIAALDDAANMTVEDIVAALESGNRDYIYVPMTVKAGDSSAKMNLQNIEYRSVYNHETGEFADDDANGVSWRWENLGEYTVVEMPMGDYFYTLYSVQTGAAVSMRNNASFTNGNTRVLSLAVTNEWAPQYVDITGTKVWNDEDNQDGMRPDSVTVHLLADGEEIDSAEVGADDDWSFIFEHLLKYRENGHLIQYQVVEDAVDGYSVTYEMTEVVDKPDGMVVEDPTTGDDPGDAGATGDGDGSGTSDEPGSGDGTGTGDGEGDGDDSGSGTVIEPEATVVAYNFTVTNTHAPFKTSVSVAKVWDDESAGDRPGSVTLHLLANGEDTGNTLELSAQDNWQGAFTDLDQNTLGEPIEYTVTEDAVDGYTSEINGDQTAGYVVTNTAIPGEEAEEDKLPPTGDELPVLALVGMLLAVVSLGGIFTARRRMQG